MTSKDKNSAPPFDERRRPFYHFIHPTGWLNDPNGLIYYQGEYHLFYQQHPYREEWLTIGWGHAVSDDLLHWTHLQLALHPDAIGSIFSGSIVNDAENTSGLVPGGGLVAVFSYQNQSQGVAYSQDRGRTWTMYESNPVIPSPNIDFRDPKVFWHAPNECWIMVIAAEDRVQFYESTNLTKWTLISDFGADQGAHDGVWECPDLFPLEHNGETKWVLLVSEFRAGNAGVSGTQYFLGDFDGRQFVNDNPPSTVLWIDRGKDNYAGATWNDMPDGRRVLIAWMNNWHYALEIYTALWNGIMTIPRELSLIEVADEGLRLAQQPIAEMTRLRGELWVIEDKTIDDEEIPLDDVRGKALEIVAEFELGSAKSFGLQLFKHGGDCSVVGYDAHHQKLFIDRRRSGVSHFKAEFPKVFSAPVNLSDGRVRMRIFVDTTSVELFSDDGSATITARIFPPLHTPKHGLFAEGGDVRLIALHVYPLPNLWKDWKRIHAKMTAEGG